MKDFTLTIGKLDALHAFEKSIRKEIYDSISKEEAAIELFVLENIEKVTFVYCDGFITDLDQQEVELLQFKKWFVERHDEFTQRIDMEWKRIAFVFRGQHFVDDPSFTYELPFSFFNDYDAYLQEEQDVKSKLRA